MVRFVWEEGGRMGQQIQTAFQTCGQLLKVKNATIRTFK